MLGSWPSANHAHGHVGLFLLAIFHARDALYLADDGLEDVGVVVGVLALEGAHQALESHTGVDDVHRELLERAVGLAVELHEHEVPDLNHLGVVHVHQLAAGHLLLLLVGTRVEVYLRAGTAGACVAHLPEVVVLVAVDDVVGGHVLEPELCSLVVALQAFFFRTLEHGDVEVFRVEVQHVDEIFPCPVDGTLLEVVAEAPVAQHLEHGVVVGVVAHLFQVVVLAAHAEAFLRVGPAAWLRVACAEDDIFPLVHSGVGEHQCGVVFYYHRCGGHDGVAFRLEEFLE